MHLTHAARGADASRRPKQAQEGEKDRLGVRLETDGIRNIARASCKAGMREITVIDTSFRSHEGVVLRDVQFHMKMRGRGRGERREREEREGSRETGNSWKGEERGSPCERAACFVLRGIGHVSLLPPDDGTELRGHLRDQVGQKTSIRDKGKERERTGGEMHAAACLVRQLHLTSAAWLWIL